MGKRAIANGRNRQRQRPARIKRTSVDLGDRIGLVRRLSKARGLSQSEILRQGVDLLAEKHGILRKDKDDPIWDAWTFEGGPKDGSSDPAKYRRGRP